MKNIEAKGKKTIRNITVDSINKSPEGQLLWTAISVIGFLKFPDSKPALILEVLKDIKLNPLVDEPLSVTMERITSKYN